QRSESLLTQAADVFAAAGDEHWLASTRIQLGALAGVRGDLAASEAQFEQSRLLARRLDDGWLLARSTLTQGALLAHDKSRSHALLQESVRASQGIGARWAIAAAIEMLALVAGHEGRSERAAKLLGASEALWETAPPAFTRLWVAAREQSRAEAHAQLGSRAFD